MSEHDVPAERDERDELRRNFAAWLDEWRYCPACDVQLQRSTGTEFVPTWHRHDDDCVLAGILALLAPQEAPSGPYTIQVIPDASVSRVLDEVEALADNWHPGFTPMEASRETVREALDAIKRAHTAVDDLCNGNSWTMSIPARPDADHDLVIDDALTKAERVIRSLTDVPAGE